MSARTSLLRRKARAEEWTRVWEGLSAYFAQVTAARRGMQPTEAASATACSDTGTDPEKGAALVSRQSRHSRFPSGHHVPDWMHP